MNLLKTALVTTVLVLATIFVLNKISFTSGLVQAAIKPAA